MQNKKTPSNTICKLTGKTFPKMKQAVKVVK